jgi:hypothetical protein
LIPICTFIFIFNLVAHHMDFLHPYNCLFNSGYLFWHFCLDSRKMFQRETLLIWVMVQVQLRIRVCSFHELVELCYCLEAFEMGCCMLWHFLHALRHCVCPELEWSQWSTDLFIIRCSMLVLCMKVGKCILSTLSTLTQCVGEVWGKSMYINMTSFSFFIIKHWDQFLPSLPEGWCCSLLADRGSCSLTTWMWPGTVNIKTWIGL